MPLKELSKALTSRYALPICRHFLELRSRLKANLNILEEEKIQNGPMSML